MGGSRGVRRAAAVSAAVLAVMLGALLASCTPKDTGYVEIKTVPVAPALRSRYPSPPSKVEPR